MNSEQRKRFEEILRIDLRQLILLVREYPGNGYPEKKFWSSFNYILGSFEATLWTLCVLNLDDIPEKWSLRGEKVLKILSNKLKGKTNV